MKRLEDEVIPAAASMASDLTVPLDLDQQIVLSAWVLKRAMVWECLGDEARPLFYRDEERRALRASRIIPINTEIWLARYVRGSDLYAFGNDGSPDADNLDQTVAAFLWTLGFGHLLVQIMSLRSARNAGDRLIVEPVKGPWSDCSIRVWPPAVHGVTWPPKLTVGREVPFDDFRVRWRRSPDWLTSGQQ